MLSVAQSTTSLLTFAVMLAVMILPLRLVKLTGFAFPCAAVALVAVMVMAPALIAEPVEAFVHWLGKDPSFSNRIPIWTFLWDYIQERPWLGYGYGAFWEDGVLPKSWFQKSLQFTPSTAHNG
jgi:exopolysaccharide production protein ExoQ